MTGTPSLPPDGPDPLDPLGRADGFRRAVHDTGAGHVSVIAHRGASHAFAENTLEAFAGAAALGADWVELDVRRSADGALLVHHDAVLADGRRVVDVDVGDAPAAVPTLDAALEVCRRHGLCVNVEIKSDPREPGFDASYATASEVADLLVGDLVTDAGEPRYLVTSFDPGCLARVRERQPSLPTGQLVFDGRDVGRLLARVADDGHVAVNPWDPLVDDGFVAAAHAAGLQVFPWTVDDPARMAALMDLDVDGIITNTPDVLRALLAEHRTSP